MAVLTYDGTELRDMTVRRCWFSLVSGWRDGLVVRGEDIVIPGKSGRDQEGRVADYRVVVLHGIVLGTSESKWDSVSTTLDGLFDPSDNAKNLVVTSPYMGLSAGSRTISARVESVRVDQIVPYLVSEWTVILHAYGSPPDWS